MVKIGAYADNTLRKNMWGLVLLFKATSVENQIYLG